MGLRERKKEATRRALKDAAVRLVLEHGLENVTVEEIASAGEVSTRTFFNYFASKEDALLGDVPRGPSEEAAREFVAGGPTGEFTEDLIRFLTSSFADSEALASWREAARNRWRLAEREPQLMPGVLARLHAVEVLIADAVAERIGAVQGDKTPKLIASMSAEATYYAMAEAETDEYHGETVDDLRACMRDSFARLGRIFGPSEA